MSDTSTLEEQTEAWADYVAARARADASLCIRDGIAAAQAWKRFLNLFLDDDHKVPVAGAARSNVTVFPVHRTRPSGLISGDAD